MQKHGKLATVNVRIKLVGLLNKAKKRLFGYPSPPAPNFWKLEKKGFLTVQKYTAPKFSEFQIRFFFFENFDPLKIFLSCCCQLVYILILV